MSTPISKSTTSTEKRILNEFASKILNEEKASRAEDNQRRSNRLSDWSEMLFHCECDDKGCSELISISSEEYKKVHHKTNQFIVTDGHISLDIEAVIESFGAYALVEKFFPHKEAL